jgi:mRNA interferase RelE/StbE
MIIKLDRSFEKDTNRIRDKKLLEQIAACLETCSNVTDLTKIKNLKKMKGAPNHYRIKIGDYRLGAVITGNTVVFERCLHRKDIYKYYPH